MEINGNSHFDYCSQLWNPHLTNQIKKLEDLQKSFIRHINGFHKKSYWQSLKRTWPSLTAEERYQIIYLWSILEGQVPNILSNGTNLIRTQSDINSRLARTIQTRPLRNTRFSNLRFNSLPFHGARLFNRLPKDVRNITCLPKMTFKRSFDSLLSHLNGEPQLLQYSNSNQFQSNSLLHRKFPVQEQPNRCGKSTLIEGQWAWMQSTSNK